MAAQIKIAAVGVPNENSTGIRLDIVDSADHPAPKVNKLDVGSTTAMSSNNMPQGRRP
jgi:hypothetical protein